MSDERRIEINNGDTWVDITEHVEDVDEAFKAAEVYAYVEKIPVDPAFVDEEPDEGAIDADDDYTEGA